MKKEKNFSTENKITEGVIWKQILLFFFPIMLGTLFQQLYNTADAVVVGRFVGTKALAAVGGSASQLINLVVGFFVGLSSGATVIIARYYGAKSEEELNNSLHTAAALSIAGSIIITVAGLLATPFMLKLMNTPANVIHSSGDYLRIYFSGIIFVFIYNVGSAILRAVGDSKRPLYYLIVCCFLNIFLDVLLVVIIPLGVAGAALATVFSQAVSAVLVVIALMKSKDLYHLEPKKIRFHGFLLASIITIGLPAGFQSIMYNASNMIIQTSLNGLGTNSMAAYTAFGKMDAIYWMVSGAFGISISTFMGQNYGAGKYNRMKKSVIVCLLMDFFASLLISIFFLTAGPQVLRLFTTDPEVIRIGMKILRTIAPFYCVFSFIEIFSSALRGIGDVLIPMIMTCCGVCLLRIFWIFVILPSDPRIENILLCYPVSWTLTAVLFIIYYYLKQKKFFASRKDTE